MDRYWGNLLVTLSILCIQLTESIKLSSVQIPALVERNSNFWLSCQYELMSKNYNDQLYSVKWYKNNEEFYRLIDDTKSDHQPQQHQQYFDQAGVNVLMSSSNATHVRLLNASLETEGFYTCEFLTQNFSTIRYEREIRVYVLPHSKLNIIGLKNRYSLDDRVNLICSTDYSRPSPAIGWFVNDQLIDRSSKLSKWFDLKLYTQSKLNEPALIRLNLSLKFKLSAEFLVALTLFHSPSSSSSLSYSLYNSKQTNVTKTGDGYNQRHESLYDTNLNSAEQQKNVDEIRQQQQQQHYDQLSPCQLQDQTQNYINKLELRLQCKYKLTEMTDFSYNELDIVRSFNSSPNVVSIFGLKDNNKQEDNYTSVSNLFDNVERPSRQEANYKNQPTIDVGVPLNKRHLSVWLTESGALLDESNSRSNQEEEGGRSLQALNDNEQSHAQKPVRLIKTFYNQVIQSICPARRTSLRLALLGAGVGDGGSESESENKSESESNGLKSSCNDYQLPLLAEDPLILVTDNNEKQCNSNGASVNNLPGVLASNGPIGDEERHKRQESDQNQIRQKIKPVCLERSVGEQILLNCSTVAAILTDKELLAAAVTNTNGVSSPTGKQCFEVNQLARRRLAITGNYQQTNEDQQKQQQHHQFGSQSATVGPNQRQRLHLLGATSKTVEANTRMPLSSSPLTVAYLVLEADQKWNLSQQLAIVTTKQHWTALTTTTGTADSFGSLWTQHDAQLVAPPLLEWFINNDEAKGSEVRYSPELPLAISTKKDIESGLFDNMNLESGPSTQDGASYGLKTKQTVLPSIDYPGYFANFQSRSIKQNLVLNLTLDERHFMTSNSKLRLRCSSTQAQIILTDSASVSILVLNGDNQQNSSYGWQSRSSNRFTTGGTHQTSARSNNAAHLTSNNIGSICSKSSLFHMIISLIITIVSQKLVNTN